MSESNLQDLTKNLLEDLEAEDDEIENTVWEYIVGDDTHHLEDFTDLEICSEEDDDEAYNEAEKLFNSLTSEQIKEMYKEIESYNIDLVDWGMIARKQLNK